MSRRVLVFGGTGFVGRHICRVFTERGDVVIAVARREPDRDFPCQLRILDLQRAGHTAIRRLIDDERPDLIINAVGSVWGHADNEMWSATTEPTLRLLDALAGTTVRPTLIHLGTILERGQRPPGAEGADRFISAYGRAKLVASEAVLARVACGDIDGMVLRIANVAGPGAPRISLPGRVAEQLHRIAAGRQQTVTLAPLRAHRDYIDVRDTAHAVLAAADAPLSGVTLDIGRGEAVDVRAVVDALIAASGVRTTVVELDHESARVDCSWTRSDIGPTLAALDWQPCHTVQDMMTAFWQSTIDCIFAAASR